MFIRVLLAAFLGAVVMFVWGMVWWMALPFPFEVMHGLPKGDEIAVTLKEKIPESGFYLHPWPDESHATDKDKAMEECMRKHREGPIMQIVFLREGIEPMSPMVFAQGFGHNVVSALIAGTLLALAGLRSYSARVGYLLLLGTFAGLVWVVNSIWMHHPWPYSLFCATNTLTNWLWAGLVMAAIIKPRSVPDVTA